jgi:ferredoxin-nitrate reductase
MWPERVDMFVEAGIAERDVETWVQSTSVLHSDGDAYDFAVRDGRIVGVRGTGSDRINRGRLGPKDLFGWQAMGAADRLRRPLVREHGELRETDWDTAMNRIVERSRALLAKPGGAGRFGFYTSGQLSLEEYYTLAVIGKAGIGTTTRQRRSFVNVCTPSSATRTAGQAAMPRCCCCGGRPTRTDEWSKAQLFRQPSHLAF